MQGRLGHPLFDQHWYLENNPDVEAAGVDPLVHYREYGWREGRSPGPWFDVKFYLETNNDVVAAACEPLQHFCEFGWREGRDPHPQFSTSAYLKLHDDVRAAGVNPLIHFVSHGSLEGREILPSELRKRQAVSDFCSLDPDPEFQPDRDFSSLHSDIKPIAFYLPQFHNSPHNNRWWGNGFTEWTNTEKAVPRFPGHYQPRQPHKDIGFYDLADPKAIASQAALARQHGIYGFCIYHYWFSGERVLDTPSNVILENPDIDLNYCLCWANENWTRTWDGQDRDVLIEQKYAADDPLKFIQDLAPFLRDKRYIRVGGKPVILIYKPHVVPNVADVFSQWRAAWKDMSGEDLLIWCLRTNPSDPDHDSLGASFDAIVEFPPYIITEAKDQVRLEIDQKKLGYETTGYFSDYQKAAALCEKLSPPLKQMPFYRGAMLAWDNSARRENGWSFWHGFSLERYYNWLRAVVLDTRQRLPDDRRYVFINAWNEWAEGTYLEPDRRYGYAALNTTSEAIFDIPFKMSAALSTCRVAAHVHIYFEDTAEEFLHYLANIPVPYDLFITTDTAQKADEIERMFREGGSQSALSVIVTPNIGRDIGPFLCEIAPHLTNYDVIGHFHSKKSTTVWWGDRWRWFLLSNLLGSRDGVAGILRQLTGEKGVGLIYPPAFPLIAPHVGWGHVERRVADLLEEVLGVRLNLPEKAEFPVGNMFWARREAIAPLIERRWRWDEFEAEEGQVGGTLPHVIERTWKHVAASAGFQSVERLIGAKPSHVSKDKRRLAIIVHYNEGGGVTEADRFLIEATVDAVDRVFVVSNSGIDAADLPASVELMTRPNTGFDFSAWRDALFHLGREIVSTFDEVLLINNSCFGPIFPYSEMFSEMDRRDCDFWGVTGFPETQDSPRPEAELLPDRRVPQHLQSYFLAFRKTILRSSVFWDFWQHVTDMSRLIDVVVSHEVIFTEKMRSAGFQYECYVPESFELQAANNSDPEFNAIYDQAFEFVMLRSPFIKKKSWARAPDNMRKASELVREFGLYAPSLLEQPAGS